MATTERTKASVKRHPLLLLALGLPAVGAVVLLIINLGPPPQMGADEAVFNTVDALFTAVTARDEKLLADCERRLLALKAAGKLPLDASAYLDNITRKARAGRWESAAQSLYDFMSVQRRDGLHERPQKEKSRSSSAKK